jgi:hypothetical protein
LVPITTQILTGNFLLLLLHLGCRTNHRSIPSFICYFRAIRVLFCASKAFIAEEVYGVPDDMSGYTVKVAVHILGRLPEHARKICPFQ